MAQYINKSALVAEIERRIKVRDFQMKSGCWVSSTYMYEDLLDFLDTLEVKEIGADLGDPQGDIGVNWVQEEPVSNDLEKAVNAYIGYAPEVDECSSVHGKRQAFKAGTEWQKEQMIDKACNYLFSHMGLFVTFFDDDIVEDIERSEFIKKFRIAMEE